VARVIQLGRASYSNSDDVFAISRRTLYVDGLYEVSVFVESLPVNTAPSQLVTEALSNLNILQNNKQGLRVPPRSQFSEEAGGEPPLPPLTPDAPPGDGT